MTNSQFRNWCGILRQTRLKRYRYNYRLRESKCVQNPTVIAAFLMVFKNDPVQNENGNICLHHMTGSE